MSRCSVNKNRWQEFAPSTWTDLDAFLGQVFGPHAASRATRQPTVPSSIWEDQQSYHVEFDVPGVQRDDIEITFEKGILQIDAVRNPRDTEGTKLHDQRYYGKTTRRVSLPESTDPDSIQAELADGVLHVTVAKAAEAQPRRIDVQ